MGTNTMDLRIVPERQPQQLLVWHEQFVQQARSPLSHQALQAVKESVGQLGVNLAEDPGNGHAAGVGQDRDWNSAEKQNPAHPDLLVQEIRPDEGEKGERQQAPDAAARFGDGKLLAGELQHIPFAYNGNADQAQYELGYLTGGIPGMLLAGAGFIIPAGILSALLAAIYVQAGSLPTKRRPVQWLQPRRICAGTASGPSGGSRHCSHSSRASPLASRCSTRIFRLGSAGPGSFSKISMSENGRAGVASGGG